MKNILYVIAALILVPTFLFSQEAEKKEEFGIKWGGFVRNDVIYNTRQVSSARGEGLFFLAPLPIVENDNGDDLNAVPNLNIIGINTRLNGKITGPDAFGAKTSGFIEGDFFGTAADYRFHFRLRHAMMKLTWEKSELMSGQYWHPSFITDCFPGTVSFGAGVPFNPLSRNPQIRYTYKLSENLSAFGAIMGQGHFKSKAGATSQPNSGIPEGHVQVQFKNKTIAAGAGVNFLALRPANTILVVSPTDTVDGTNTIIAKNNAIGLSYQAYFKYTHEKFTAKLWGMYGQMNDNMVMMGGFYQIRDTTLTLADLEKEYIEYTPNQNLSTWVDFNTNGKKFQVGLFGGYAMNMGAAEDVELASFKGRWNNVNTMLRVAPRFVFISGSTKIAAEIEYSSVDYATQGFESDGVTPLEDVGGIDINGNVTNYQTANNIKFLLSFTYSF